MIDVHTHIIPLIDDGSNNYEESYLMMCEAEKVGFTDIITTSHYIEEKYNANVLERQNIIEDLQNYEKEHNINVNIYTGNEIYITLNMAKLIKENKASSLANSKYVLFELPMNTNVMYLFQCIFELKSEGYIPVIAHPERYRYVQENPNILIKWIEKGVLIQSNFASIIGYYGKEPQKVLKKMLKANMVHFLGTDAHDVEKYKLVPKCIKQIEKCIGKEKTIQITTMNPMHIINNEEFAIQQPEEIKKGWIF